MEDLPFGMIELILGFGALLCWAAWEVRSNRRAMAKAREKK